MGDTKEEGRDKERRKIKGKRRWERLTLGLHVLGRTLLDHSEVVGGRGWSGKGGGEGQGDEEREEGDEELHVGIRGEAEKSF